MLKAPIDFADYQRYKIPEVYKRYHETTEYMLFKKSTDKAFKDLKKRFESDDFEFIDECIGIIIIAEYQKMEFIYSVTYKDWVNLLKKLNILI